jgi:hypothetical protein
MRKRMREQVFRAQLVADGTLGYVLSSLAALLEPSISTSVQRRDSTLHLGSRPPTLKHMLIESEKKSFTKLFNGGQPSWIPGKWCAPHGEPHVFELFGDDGSWLEPGETI